MYLGMQRDSLAENCLAQSDLWDFRVLKVQWQQREIHKQYKYF